MVNFQQPFFKKIIGTGEIPKKPNHTITNPIKQDVYVNSIEITPDAYFSRKGKIRILINDTVILKELEVGAYSGQKLFQIPLDNQILNKQSKIEFFVWNGLDRDKVSLSVNLQISDQPSSVVFSGIPTNVDELNSLISDNYISQQTQFQLDKLDSLIDSVDEISVSSETIPQAITQIQEELDSIPTPTGSYLTALNGIHSALIGLENGFDIDELFFVITTFNENLVYVADENPKLYDLLVSLKIQLEIASKNPALIPSRVDFLFPKRVYRNETAVQLINTKGNRNLIVLLGASTIEKPVNFSSGGSPGNVSINYTLSLGGNSTTSAGTVAGSQNAVVRTKVSKFDFKYPSVTDRQFDLDPSHSDKITIGTHNCVYAYTNHYFTTQYRHEASYTRTFDVYESDFANFSVETQLKNDVESSELRSIIGSKRYLRIVEKMSITIRTVYASSPNHANGSAVHTCPSSHYGNHTPSPTTFGDVADSSIVGGTARLSFEVKDANNNWFTLIPSTEVGAVTSGQQTTFEVGEAVSGHVLPSTQTHFRAKLAVTGGGIETSASIIRVA